MKETQRRNKKKERDSKTRKTTPKTNKKNKEGSGPPYLTLKPSPTNKKNGFRVVQKWPFENASVFFQTENAEFFLKIARYLGTKKHKMITECAQGPRQNTLRF